MNHFMDVVDSINPDASPGYPWGLLVNEKGRLLESELVVVYEQVNQRLNRYLHKVMPGDGPLKAYQLVQGGFTDPVRIFVKNEPHSAAKVANRRFRLVSSVSIIDEICERLLGSVQNEAEIDEWLKCPSKPGIGLSTDEQQQAMYKSIRDWLSGAKISDVRGWDWAFKAWNYSMDCRARIRLASGPGHATWSKLLTARFECLKWTMFITSGGEIFIQTKPGIMLSGSYFTASTNSRARVGVAFITGAVKAGAMGDDCIEKNDVTEAEFIRRYDELGFTVTDVAVCTTDFEFCSHKFGPAFAVPMNLWKGFFRLISKVPDQAEYLQFLAEYRHRELEILEIEQFLLTLPDWCEVINGIIKA